MRLHRFFIGEYIEDNAISVNDIKLIHQWRNVFRFSLGDKVILFDGSGNEFVAEIKALKKGEALLAILEKKKGIVPERNVWLFVGIPKKTKFELIVEKATELGVSHIVPVITERGEKKGLPEERLRKILKEASEQSGRATIPSLQGIFSLEDALLKHTMPLIVCHPSGDRNVSETFSGKEVIGIFIGPEGGFSERELLLFKKHKSKIISLGPQTLRTETAAIAALTLALLK